MAEGAEGAEGTRLSVVFLWHFHQPDYRHPEQGVPVLPWVRLHAVRGYTDMVAALERHPGVAVTLNWVPVLLDQWQDLCDGTEDAWLTLCRRHPVDLTPEERRRLTTLLFCAHPRTMIDPLERYRELHQRHLAAREQEAVGDFDDQELIDLLVLFHLAWSGAHLRERAEVQALLAQGRDYALADRDALLAVHQDEIRGLLERVRQLEQRGQIETSTTPWGHPILPLLCELDSNDYQDAGEPFRFSWPADARWHVEQALVGHQRWLGRRPTGMWPAEGAVSPAAVEQFAAAGVRWVASDEALLFRSLGPDTGRHALYQPWRVPTPAGEVTVLFRDHDLSDRIGFVYQDWDAVDAAQDFVARLEEIADAVEGPAVVTITLDGENPWEHYPEAGAPFLDALYGRLQAHDRLHTTTPGRLLGQGDSGELSDLATGSWIDGNLDTWAGHEEKRQAWRLLTAVREAAGPGALTEQGVGLTRHLQVLEGSDWYWWLGDDHATDQADVFDDLFLAHVRQAWRALGQEVPWLPELRDHAATEPERLPLDRVRPTGGPQDTLQWECAGTYRVRPSGGAMTAATALARRVVFGWDGDTWHLGVVIEGPVAVRLVVTGAEPVVRQDSRESFLKGRAVRWFTDTAEGAEGFHFHLHLTREDGEEQRWPGRGDAWMPAAGERPGTV